MNLFSVSRTTRLIEPMLRICLAVAISSSLSATLSFWSSGVSSTPSSLTHRGTLARPSVMATITTLPTSPVFWALMAVRMATISACAKGDPPPHGMVSSLFLAIEMDLVGGSSTSARSPWKGMRQIWSRLWYASASMFMHAPLQAFMRLSAIEPEASTQKITSAPALRAILLIRTSDCSMYTLRSGFVPPSAFTCSARRRRGF
mmetsp:Transcript_69814/g.102309  ORF Transcript_69814/g.102309 Transcript_69814/m.102309 type:complete len:203 (-) Transcript_69814:1661-2269(-)